MLRTLIICLVTTLVCTSCGVDGNHFKLEGRILNMNQGEFYVYSEDAQTDGIDTIKVEGGRFVYEMPCTHATTLMLVFPNFSEQPIFAVPGKSVDISGDASHLKMLQVEGTRDNELMTQLREQMATASPPEMKQYARQFVEDHPESSVGVYLVKKYFVLDARPDYETARKLIAAMQAAQKDNGQLNRMATLVKNYPASAVGKRLPVFTAYDTKGRLVSSSDLSTGLAMICTWASWNYDSMDQLRAIRRQVRKSGGRLKVVSIAIEASKKDCGDQLKRDSITWSNVCDGRLFEGKMVQQLSLQDIPDNMLVKNGRIVARSIKTSDLEAEIQRQL